MRNEQKKPLLSDSLATGDNKGLQSANADQHRDRITRFGILKHRAKQQENFLWTLAKFKENYRDFKDFLNQKICIAVGAMASGRNVIFYVTKGGTPKILPSI